MTTLVIAAHPDDEVLGCGGTIKRLTSEGEDVYIAILGEGITSRYNDREIADQSLIDALNANSKAVAEYLGAKDLFMYGLPDNRFDMVPLLDIVKIVETLVEKLQPTTVFTQHGGDLNIDHVQTYRSVLTATRPMKGSSIKNVYSYQVASSTEWAFQQFAPKFEPNLFVDISNTIEDKIHGIQMYESEVRAFPHPRSPEALRSQARYFGSMTGLDFAEAFCIIRQVVSL